MRIRSIKPAIHKDEELWDLELETGLPLFRAYTGLWGAADREGRFEWRPRMLQSDILPYWKGDFSRVLDALTTRGFLVRYASGARQFGWIPTLKEHQVFNNREQASKLPPPPDSVIITWISTREGRVRDACGSSLSLGLEEQEQEQEQEREYARAREIEVSAKEEEPTVPPPLADSEPWLKVIGLWCRIGSEVTNSEVVIDSQSHRKDSEALLRLAGDSLEKVESTIRACWEAKHAQGKRAQLRWLVKDWDVYANGNGGNSRRVYTPSEVIGLENDIRQAENDARYEREQGNEQAAKHYDKLARDLAQRLSGEI